MSAQYHGSAQPTIGADGVKTYIDRNGDTVQESSGPVPIFRGLAAAGGEAFVSDSEEETSEEEYHQHHAAHYIPQHGHSMPVVEKKKSKKEKKEKKSKKEKKERSGSSSSGHACSCSHNHH